MYFGFNFSNIDFWTHESLNTNTTADDGVVDDKPIDDKDDSTIIGECPCRKDHCMICFKKK